MQLVQKPWLLHALFWAMVFAMMMVAGPNNETYLMEIVRKLII